MKQGLAYPNLSTQLRNVVAELRTTRFVMLNALFVLTLEKFIGHSLLPVAVPNAGRDFENSEGLVVMRQPDAVVFQQRRERFAA